MSTDLTLTALLETFRASIDRGATSVGDILGDAGDRSFATAILLTALVLISPLSGIPTLPTFGAVIIFLAAGQWLIKRDHIWLPGVIRRRALAPERAHQAIGWLAGPARFVDRYTMRRLTTLTGRVAEPVILTTIMAIVLTWPFLELLPFFTSFGATIVASLAFGLLVRDGLFVVIGYAALGALAGGILWLL